MHIPISTHETNPRLRSEEVPIWQPKCAKGRHMLNENGKASTELFLFLLKGEVT